MSKPWTRWEDWAIAVVGVLVALVPTAVTATGRTLGVLVALGLLLALVSLFSLAQPTRAMASEWVTLVLGVLLFVAPWVLTYTAHTGATWSRGSRVA